MSGLIFLLIGFVAVGSQWQQVQGWYWVHVAGPTLEKEFGFRGGLIPWQGPNGITRQLFGIAEVVPGGAFQKAGFQPNDVIAGWFWGFRGEFYSALAEARETGTVEVPYVPVQDIRFEEPLRPKVRVVEVPAHVRLGA